MRKRCFLKIQHRRAGLAPLELVLYLPIMLFVMALMVNFGNIAAWKVRAQSNTRYAGTRTLDDRTGNNEANPNTWPRSATLGSSGGNSLNDVNAIWNQHPDLITPVTRGPVIVDNEQGGSIVVPGRFSMDEGVHAGDGHVSRKLPMLRGILANDGSFSFTQHQEFLDNRWEYRHLVHPNNPYDRRDVPGDSGNNRRRAKRWYKMDPEFVGEIASEVQQLKQARQRLMANPSKHDLDPLDSDFDYYSIRKARQSGGLASDVPPPGPDDPLVGVPDFHPTATVKCELDLQRVQRDIVDSVVKRVEKLPGSMAQAFSGLYSREIARLKRMLQTDPGEMPLPQAEIARIEAEIARIQRLLDQVNRFLKLLPKKYKNVP